MIKNILILTLTVAVIGMYFLMSSNNSNDIKNRMTVEFQNKFDSFKQEFLNAYDLGKKNEKPSVNNDISNRIETKKIDKKKTNFVNAIDDKQPGKPTIKEKTVKRTPAKLTVDNNKTKKKTNENVSKEDINQIMSILNSAEDMLHKTNFEFKRVNKPTPAKNFQNKTDSEVKIIKKKSFPGQKELG